MRFLILLAFLVASPALAQTALDWTDGGAIQLPTADLDGDAYPAGTTMRCVVSVAGANIIINSTPGTVFPILRTTVPKVSGATTTASATGACTTPLSTEVGAPDTRLVSLRPWRGSQSPTLLP